MSLTCGTYIEQCQALRDVQMLVNQYGKPATVYIRAEGDIIRDSYNSIVASDITSAEAHSWKMFPFTTSPTTKELEKAGIKENVECLGYFAYKDILDAGHTYSDLEIIRMTVVTDGNTYLIKQMNQDSAFLDTYLYVTVGLVAK